MLRESSRLEGKNVDLKVITAGSEVNGGVDAELELVAFAEAALGDDVKVISTARSRLEAVVGKEAVVDAAAVIGNLQRMVIIADGTGIPLDTPLAMVTVGIRSQLGLNSYGSADNTPTVGLIKRWIGAVLSRFLPLLFRSMARRAD